MTIFRFSLRRSFLLVMVLICASPVDARDLALSPYSDLVRTNQMLIRTYQRTMARLGKADRATLSTSERAWMSRSKAHCNREAAQAAEESPVMGPGAAAQLMETVCRQHEAESRILVLREWGRK